MNNLKLRHWTDREAGAAGASWAPIDLVHLFRMTMGDRDLQQEILDLFDQQIGILIERMHDAEPATLATLAHTLKGSARSIGAWDLVHATERIEAAVAGRESDHVAELAALAVAAQRVHSAIAEMRQSEAGPPADL